MLEPQILVDLIKTHRPTLQSLLHVEDILKERFVGMEVHIRALILAVACGEPLLLVGPPGTAKSRLIRAFCGTIGLLKEDQPASKNEAYFEYLLTQFTEPGELFGHYDLAELHKSSILRRMDKGMMQNAKVVFLDEVFNASSAVLNSILSFMNEQLFHDRGEVRPVKMRCMFSATNDVPQGGELRAVYDRFVLRSWVHSVSPDPMDVRDLVSRGRLETYKAQHVSEELGSLLDQVERLRQDIGQHSTKDKLRLDDDVVKTLAYLVRTARQYNASAVSNRRLVKFSYVMTMHRLLRAVQEPVNSKPLRLGKPELDLFATYFLDTMDPAVVTKLKTLPLTLEDGR